MTATRSTCSVIGLDPGMNTGVARYAGGVLEALETVLPWGLRCLLTAHAPTLVVFEDSRQQSHTWTRSSSRAASLKMARNVGEIDAWCKLIEAECSALGIKCIGVSPSGKGAKLDAAAFNRLTWWAGASNQHTRDAGAVAWRYRKFTPAMAKAL